MAVAECAKLIWPVGASQTRSVGYHHLIPAGLQVIDELTWITK